MTNESAENQQYLDEDLVAYLDGELPSDQVTAINESIQQNTELRTRIDRLRVTWDLLEELPEDEPSPNLAQSTIEMVSLAIAKDQKSWYERLKGKRWILLATGLLLAFSLGVASAQQRSSLRKRQFLNDLPILVHYDDLALIDSMEWLQRLTKIEDLLQAAQQQSEIPIDPLPTDLEEREAWVQSLDNAKRARIAEHGPAFRQDSPTRREQLRAMAELFPQEIQAGDDVNYLELLTAYHSIIDRVGTGERTQLYALEDLEERAAAVTELVNREMAIAYAERMSNEDRIAFRDWSYDLQNRLWEVFERLPDPDAKVVDEIYRPPEKSLVTDEDLAELSFSLSDEAKELLVGLDTRLQRDVLGVWLFYVFEPTRSETPQQTAEALRERFEQLSNDKKSQMEFLSEKDVREELSF